MIDKEVAKLFDRRSALFLTGGAILTSVLVLRMLQMQLFNYREYTQKSQNNSFRIQINMPERGKILSADGKPISRDAPTYRIYIIPEETDDVNATVATIANELKLSKKRKDYIYARIKKQRAFQPVLITENSDWTMLAKLQARNIPGVHIRNGFARVYEMGPAGAQIFGYVGSPETPVENAPFFTTGVTGLEKRYNDVLAGIPGQTVMITNAVGRVTGEDKTQFRPAITGNNLGTTIRGDIQRILYDELTLYRSGCGVVLDIKTGDILAMVSAPSFDPNMFDSYDAESGWSAEGLTVYTTYRIVKELFGEEYAINNNIPLLGICMGHQIIGLYNQKLEESDLVKIDNHYSKDELHLVNLMPGTYLEKILGKSIYVNSRHLYKLDSVSEPLVVSAKSTDDVIEAIEWIDDEHLIIGVQWHPEDMNNMDDLYNFFISETLKRRLMKK